VAHPHHLGALLAVSPDGAAAAVAASARRLAVLPIAAEPGHGAASPPGSPRGGAGLQGSGGGGAAATTPAATLVAIGEPAVFTGGDGMAVAGARRRSDGATAGTPAAAWAPAGLGSVWDLAWLAPSGAPGGAHHLAALVHRPSEQASELLLLRWERGGGCSAPGALELVCSIAVPHCGRAAAVGVPGRALAVPGWPGGLALVGDGGVAAVDCAAALAAAGIEQGKAAATPAPAPDEQQEPSASVGLEASVDEGDEAAAGTGDPAPAAATPPPPTPQLALAPLLRGVALRGAPRRFGAAPGSADESPEASWGDGMAAAPAAAAAAAAAAADTEDEHSPPPGSMAAWRRHAWPIEVGFLTRNGLGE
jgi:hypothetical protein